MNFRQSRHLPRWLLAFCLVLPLLGCGKKDGKTGNVLYGRVLHEDEPIPFGSVTLREMESGKVVGMSPIQRNGEYRIENLPEGEMVLMVSATMQGGGPGGGAPGGGPAGGRPGREPAGGPAGGAPPGGGPGGGPRGGGPPGGGPGGGPPGGGRPGGFGGGGPGGGPPPGGGVPGFDRSKMTPEQVARLEKLEKLS